MEKERTEAPQDFFGHYQEKHYDVEYQMEKVRGLLQTENVVETKKCQLIGIQDINLCARRIIS
jgi:hypothetical protein